MNTDALSRRKRSLSQSTGKGVRMSPGLERLLTGMRRRNPLPTPLLFHLWKGADSSNYHHFQTRLTDYFHEKEGGGPFLRRPAELNPSFGPQYEPNWYQISAAGLALVKNDLPVQTNRDHIRHRAMSASIDVSFEILAAAHCLTFIHLEDVLLHRKCPDATSNSLTPLRIQLSNGKFMEPDGLFGFAYRTRDEKQVRRFFFREEDRCTEDFGNKSASQDTVRVKLENYVTLLGDHRYVAKWGLPLHKPLVLFTTTKHRRVARCLDYLKGKPHADRFLFKVLPQFGTLAWRAPREPLHALFEPWETVNGLFDITNA